MKFGLIFDFDGVIADSEVLAGTILAKFVSDLGLATTLNEVASRYGGKRWSDIMAAIEDGFGQKLPEGFSDRLKEATLSSFRQDLRAVEGVAGFLTEFRELPHCVASSSSLDRLILCLDILGLTKEFGDFVFSAEMVARGKPFPDVFLLAAERMKVNPLDCIVIEDSANGVRAGVAAGMTVIGLCAASHLQPGHAQRLMAAGASYSADSWSEVSAIVSALCR
jgi:HAD superfamily hydrolase (TIGR01509 family)